jgi:hypothetical protein
VNFSTQRFPNKFCGTNGSFIIGSSSFQATLSTIHTMAEVSQQQQQQQQQQAQREQVTPHS